ncbi:MAG: alpha-L-rhamnosidase N-terminal domain-containing protein [Deltaproteobacteria bacterium]|nr:alpha-L-rhamnosidase N-terminal domain-containing protein [Deltaproteobacteria bacterium]MBI3389855.1 alpha-L-rhamnosidase N-terminal domain-containing protein [Deltaproteobacteria bacterium]
MYRRTPFIWTSKQVIDPLALWRVFFGGPMRRDDGTNRWFLFRRVFELPARADDARLTITVDGRYQIFINGTRVGRGPVRCDPMHQRTDTYDIAAHLHTGTNVIAVLVRVYGVDTSWYQRVEGHWQPVFGDGGLYCDAQVRCGESIIDLLSDEHWWCCECTAWQRDTPRSAWGLGFIEVHDANQMPTGWADADFDDSQWDRVHILTAGGGSPDSMMGGMKIEPFPTLLPREIPFLIDSPLAPQRILRWYGARPALDRPVERQLYDDDLIDLPPHLVEQPDALLTANDEATTVRTTPELDVSLMLDFGRIHSGHPFIEIDAHGGEIIDLAVAEGIPEEWSATPPKRPRLDVDRGHGMHLFRYIARPGRQHFERFEWTAVRYMQITVRNAPAGLRIAHVGSTFTRYPAEHRGSFECSDAMLTRLWDIGRYTLQLCMHDGWEDCPSREQRQWLGDATVEFLVSQAAFGPSANALNRQFLLHAAESQRPDGLTQMFAPGDHHTNAVLIPDWTLQWILNAEHHWLFTGDLDTIEQIFPAIQRALAWFTRQIGPHDLVAESPYWHFMDWAALGRHGEAAALNAQLTGALRAAAQLARALESPRAARNYDALAARVGAALNARHWDTARGVYVDSVDPATGAQDRRVSQHANGAAILWGVAPPERWPSMVDYITDPARLKFTAAPPIAPTGEPFDPETDVVLANTFYSHFVYRALCRAGRFDRALVLMRTRYGDMLARGATTLWESFDPTASLCHGFSATPVYQLSTEVLGVSPIEPGFARFRVAPQFADLAQARGVFPTIRGDIRVGWQRYGAGIDLDVAVPAGSCAEVVAPSGYRAAGEAFVLQPGTHRVRFETD